MSLLELVSTYTLEHHWREIGRVFFWEILCDFFHKFILTLRKDGDSLPDRHRKAVMRSTEIGYNSKVEGDVVHTNLEAAVNWFRKNSLWPMPMGLAC